MKNINLDSIFEVFDQGDEQVYNQAGLNHLMNDDTILLNTVVRGIESFWKLDEVYLNRYPDQYKNIRVKVKNKYFNKMNSYLSKVSLNKLEPFYDTVSDLGYGTVENTFLEYLDYFIEIEEYEKCIKINEILNIVRNLHYPESKIKK